MTIKLFVMDPDSISTLFFRIFHTSTPKSGHRELFLCLCAIIDPSQEKSTNLFYHKNSEFLLYFAKSLGFFPKKFANILHLKLCRKLHKKTPHFPFGKWGVIFNLLDGRPPSSRRFPCRRCGRYPLERQAKLIHDLVAVRADILMACQDTVLYIPAENQNQVAITKPHRQVRIPQT